MTYIMGIQYVMRTLYIFFLVTLSYNRLQMHYCRSLELMSKFCKDLEIRLNNKCKDKPGNMLVATSKNLTSRIGKKTELFGQKIVSLSTAHFRFVFRNFKSR